MNEKHKKAIIAVAVAIAIFLCGYFLSVTKEINISVKVNGGATATNFAQSQVTSAAVATVAPEITQAVSAALTESKPAESKPAEKTESIPTSSDSSSMSTEKIVEIYNTAANKVKTEATTLTRNYKKLESLPEYLELPSAIQSIGSAAIGQFVKGSDTPESWTSKEDMQIIFPVGGTDYTSHLTADMVESATCTDNGSTYQIELKLYDDKLTSPEKGQGYAGVFNTVTASSITSVNIPTVTFNTVDVNGINGSISCTIDKASQRVTEITFRNTDILKLNVKVVFSAVDAKLALAVEENFSIQY